MTLYLSKSSSAFEPLRSQGYDVRPESGIHGDPVRVALLNQMSPKAMKGTDIQWAGLFANATRHVHLTVAIADGSPRDNLGNRPFISDIWDQGFDAFYGTGAPHEHKGLNENEIPGLRCLRDMLDRSVDEVCSSYVTCWYGSLALLHDAGVPIRVLKLEPEGKKLFGLYPQHLNHGLHSHFAKTQHAALEKAGGEISLPVARYCYVDPRDLAAADRSFEIILGCPITGPGLIYDAKNRRVIALNHGEYDIGGLAREYNHYRDSGLALAPPVNCDLATANDRTTPSPWRPKQQAIIDTHLEYVDDIRIARRFFAAGNRGASASVATLGR